MRIGRLMLVGVVVGLLWVGIAETAAKADTKAAAPDIQWPQSPCNLNHRMDIAIVDGLFFECVCSRLQVNYECSWWIVAGVDPITRKRIKRRHAPHVTRIYVRPSVVA